MRSLVIFLIGILIVILSYSSGYRTGYKDGDLDYNQLLVDCVSDATVNNISCTGNQCDKMLISYSKLFKCINIGNRK